MSLVENFAEDLKKLLVTDTPVKDLFYEHFLVWVSHLWEIVTIEDSVTLARKASACESIVLMTGLKSRMHSIDLSISSPNFIIIYL